MNRSQNRFKARLRKYCAVAGTSFRHVFILRGEMIGRGCFFVMILFIFSRLWEVVASAGFMHGVSSTDMIWYLAATEWVLFCMPLMYLDIEDDIRTGEIAYRLIRPLSYLETRLAESAGAICARSIIMAFVGFTAASLMSGGLPANNVYILFVIPIGLMAAFVGTLFLILIGISAIWLQDVSPVYWVWQKFTFILGGLMLPLHFYPEWLNKLASWTPFYALLYGAGRVATIHDTAFTLRIVFLLLLWGTIAFAFLVALFHLGMKRIDINGG